MPSVINMIMEQPWNIQKNQLVTFFQIIKLHSKYLSLYLQTSITSILHQEVFLTAHGDYYTKPQLFKIQDQVTTEFSGQINISLISTLYSNLREYHRRERRNFLKTRGQAYLLQDCYFCIWQKKNVVMKLQQIMW